MARTGFVGHDPDLAGSVLILYGGGAQVERVFVGPRSYFPGSGRVKVSSDGQNVVDLYGTERQSGRLRLSATSEEDGPRWLFLAAAERTDEDARYGLLRLRSVSPDGTGARDLVRLGGDDYRWTSGGRLWIGGPGQEGECVIDLRIDGEAGPLLEMTDSGRSVRFSPQGIFTSGAAKERFLDNLVAEDPTDRTRAIYYTVVEGPEVGLYVRGSARVRGGQAREELPEHFAHLVSPHGMTAQVTARSAETRGVAVVELSPRHLVIRELAGGEGEFEVDYLVQGVRAGFEDFQVVRPRRGFPPEKPR